MAYSDGTLRSPTRAAVIFLIAWVLVLKLPESYHLHLSCCGCERWASRGHRTRWNKFLYQSEITRISPHCKLSAHDGARRAVVDLARADLSLEMSPKGCMHAMLMCALGLTLILW